MIKTTFLLFDGIEVLDFIGPYSVLTLLRLDEAQRRNTESPFQIKLCALNGASQVRTTSGLEISTPDALSAGADCDLLCVPGGFGVRKVLEEKEAPGVIKDISKAAKVVSSICTGSLLLAQAGLLKNLKATTHHKSLDLLSNLDQTVEVQADQRVVVNEGASQQIFTSSGIAAGIDLGLALVAHFFDETLSNNIAQHMEYVPPTIS